MQKAQKGFTLIELLIVVAIIGLLATLAIVSLSSAQERARDTKRVADLKSIQTAVELYFSDNGSYPAAGATWDGGVGTNLADYINTLPTDPQNTGTAVYTYFVNTTDGVYALGAELENDSNPALDEDVDTTFGDGATAADTSITSGDTQTASNAQLDCNATAFTYCISN